MPHQLIRRGTAFAKQFALIILPKLISGVGTAVISWIAFQHMSTSQFGVLSLCLSAIMMADGVLGSAFDLAVVRLATSLGAENQLGLEMLQRGGIVLKVATAGFAGVLLLTFHRPLLHDFFKGDGSPALLALTLAAACMVLLVRSAQLQFQLERRFRAYGSIDLAHNGLKLAGVAVLAGAGYMRPSLVLGMYVMSPALVFLVWATRFGAKILAGAVVSLSVLQETLKQARWFLLTFGTGWLASRADIWMVARFTTVHDTGVYSAAQIVAMIPPLIGAYMSVVLSPRVMPLLNEGRLLGFTRRLQTVLLLTSVAGYLVALFLLPQMAPALPIRYREALPVVLVLLPGSLGAFVSFPLTLTTLMFLRPRFLVAMDCITLPFILGAFAFLVPRYGLICAAWISTAGGLLRAAIAQIAALAFVGSAHRKYHSSLRIDWPEVPPEVSSI
jgi:O-antigen/teichoic acid export membrane protein